jgi:hypothetical protein
VEFDNASEARVSVSMIVTRADGSVEDLGVVAEGPADIAAFQDALLRNEPSLFHRLMKRLPR